MSAATEISVARRGFFRAAIIGGVVAAIPFAWMLAIGRLDFLQRHGFDGFYDAQAHSLLAGRWNVPQSALGFEAFVIKGKAYEYFGPFPAVLRMPVAQFTHRFDGRLTQPSILLGFVVLLVAVVALSWRVRMLVRANETVTRLEQWAIATFVLVVGAGSVVLFLASRPIVYHETELWGAAWAIAALAAILGEIVRPNRRDLLAAGVFTTFAMLTRGSVGLAPVAALGLVFAGAALAAVAHRAGRPGWTRPLRALGLPERAPSRAHIVGLLAAVVVPFALYAYVNQAKFDTPLRLPIDKQIATQIDPVRVKIFDETNGSLFAPKFVPTDVLAALRPDGIRFVGAYPFVTFPPPAHEVGNVTFAARDPQASLPATMPFLFVFAIVGVVAVFLPSRRAGTALAPLRVLVLASIVGAAGVLTIPFVNQRYLSDFLPLLVVAGSAGLLRVLARVDGPRAAERTTARRVAIAVGAVLAVASLVVNFALALQYQRAYSPFTSDADRAAFVRFQAALDDHLPGGSHLRVRRGERLPAPLAGGTLFVVGDCGGVYWSDGTTWRPIERTPATGSYPLRITLPDPPAGTRESILVGGPERAPDPLDVVYLGAGRVRFALRGRVSDPVAIRPGRPVDVDIVYDRRLPQAEVYLDGRSVFGAPVPLPDGPVDVAGFSDAPRVTFSGRARPRAPTAAFCRSLVDQRVASGSNS